MSRKYNLYLSLLYCYVRISVPEAPYHINVIPVYNNGTGKLVKIKSNFNMNVSKQ